MAQLKAWRIVPVMALALVAAGCVSTSDSRPQADKKEAAQYNMQLGISYLRQGDLKTAQAKLEKAIADDDTLATAHSALGLVFERLGDARGAEKQYRRAVSLAPDDPDALNALAVFLCLQKQDTREAMKNFERAMAVPLSKAVTNQAMLRINAGLCAKRFDLARAEEYFRSALALDPGSRGALLQLADVAHGRGNYLQARAFVERYLAGGPATAEILWLGVRTEQALGDPQAARGYGERLKSQFPESIEMRLLLESERNAGR
jgi:type IV pilus assembly protein PilF